VTNVELLQLKFTIKGVQVVIEGAYKEIPNWEFDQRLFSAVYYIWL
jgi:hypothetical protein